MNRRDRLKAEKAAALSANISVVGRLRRFGIFKLLALMFVTGFFMMLATVHLIQPAISVGMSPQVANNLPFLGFAVGALVILCAALSHAAMEALEIGLAIPLQLFALMGLVLAVVGSVLGALMFLDVALIGLVATGLFALVLVALNKVIELFGNGPLVGSDHHRMR